MACDARWISAERGGQMSLYGCLSARTVVGLTSLIGQQSAAYLPFHLESSRTAAYCTGFSKSRSISRITASALRIVMLDIEVIRAAAHLADVASSPAWIILLESYDRGRAKDDTSPDLIMVEGTRRQCLRIPAFARHLGPCRAGRRDSDRPRPLELGAGTGTRRTESRRLTPHRQP